MSMVVALTEMETTSDVLSDVHAERMRQDEKFGEQSHDDGTWGLVLTEEVGEACQAALESRRNPCLRRHDLLREELVQVAAVAVAWIEALDRR
jgi:NTP pyrophosphatase (non-canonical NTP hydrolase)